MSAKVAREWSKAYNTHRRMVKDWNKLVVKGLPTADGDGSRLYTRKEVIAMDIMEKRFRQHDNKMWKISCKKQKRRC